ncbi:hypothetical protein PV326_009309 [Microctonus aethiopoides]|nr:hypothetical protein PV326_009309 [Microctonus aethiopoides]
MSVSKRSCGGSASYSLSKYSIRPSCARSKEHQSRFKHRFIYVFEVQCKNDRADEDNRMSIRLFRVLQKDKNFDSAILQRITVATAQLQIKASATCLYLCMDSCGLLYGSQEILQLFCSHISRADQKNLIEE